MARTPLVGICECAAADFEGDSQMRQLTRLGKQ